MLYSTDAARNIVQGRTEYPVLMALWYLNGRACMCRLRIHIPSFAGRRQGCNSRGAARTPS
eukprot:730936-Rhodomonas_salina.2